ncbi:MAG TPA: hypothetical protein VGB87_03140, partial [Vicinamibacteria bacterium]
ERRGWGRRGDRALMVASQRAFGDEVSTPAFIGIGWAGVGGPFWGTDTDETGTDGTEPLDRANASGGPTRSGRSISYTTH